jgi:chaperonin GroEL
VRPSIVFSPNLVDGINMMADAVKPTLGPLPRQVGIERIERGRMPELLDDAGLIARRIIQLEDPTADVGAMMLRHGMWRIHERIGDGAATMAVLTQAMMREAVKGVAAGMHPMWLRRGIERGAQAAVDELRRNARPLAAGKAGRMQLSALAYALSADKELMDAIVAIVNNIGSEGAVDVIINERRSIDYEFIEGALYNAGWISAAFVTDKARTIARQEDAAVILLQGSIDSAEQAVEIIRQLAAHSIERVALIAHGVSEAAQQVFTHVHLQGALQFILIEAPSVDEERLTALHDISALTGARLLFDIGELMRVRAEDIGFARRLWATAKKFGIIAGRSDGEMLRGRAETVRAAIANFSDKKNWEQLDKLRWRLAQLTGGIAVLQVGALTRALADTRRDHAKRLIQVLQYATGNGLVVGGGAAYIACRAAVEQAAAQTDNADERYGVRCVAQALTAPLGVLAHNAGYDSAPVISSVKQAEPEHGFDARSGKIVNLWDAGIVDALLVVERALQTAASVTAMAITTDAVIHQRKSYPGPATP